MSCLVMSLLTSSIHNLERTKQSFRVIRNFLLCRLRCWIMMTAIKLMTFCRRNCCRGEMWFSVINCSLRKFCKCLSFLWTTEREKKQNKSSLVKSRMIPTFIAHWTGNENTISRSKCRKCTAQRQNARKLIISHLLKAINIFHGTAIHTERSITLSSLGVPSGFSSLTPFAKHQRRATGF